MQQHNITTLTTQVLLLIQEQLHSSEEAKELSQQLHQQEQRLTQHQQQVDEEEARLASHKLQLEVSALLNTLTKHRQGLPLHTLAFACVKQIDPDSSSAWAD